MRSAVEQPCQDAHASPLPGVPLHVSQRGNNRQTCFHAHDDYATYLYWLEESALERRVTPGKPGRPPKQREPDSDGLA